VDILLDNAVKYTPEGGTVTVHIGKDEAGVELAVADTGIGIPAEHLPQIFDRFYRADESRPTGGAGLGLAIARQIAEQLGGTIRAASVPGQGSTFTLRLPLDMGSAL
jgi:signal transduction histidine kinase